VRGKSEYFVNHHFLTKQLAVQTRNGRTANQNARGPAMRPAIRAVVFALWLFSVSIYGFSQAEGILTDTLKLRTEPSLKSKQTGTLKKGARVTLTQASPTNGFYHVRISRNREGWIWAKGVKILKPGSKPRKTVRRPASLELEPRRPGEATATCQPDLASGPPAGCAAPDSPHGLAKQPHRFALWEVHPVTHFVVCRKMDNSCDPSQPGDWSALGGS
jgi:hypothetical protein